MSRTAGIAAFSSICPLTRCSAGIWFTQPGANLLPVTESEVLTASEGMRGTMDYYARATSTGHLKRLARLYLPVHGSAYRGDSAARLRELSAPIERGNGKVNQR